MTLSGLRIWLGVPWLQRRVLVRAAVWLGLVDLGLRLLGFRRMIGLVPTVAAESAIWESGHVPMYVAALELVAGRYPVPAHCLHKSLVLQFWLRSEGIPSSLRIGVRKEQDELKAHAWVELGGRVLNDDAQAVASFRPLAASHITNVTWTSVTGETRTAVGGLRKAEA